MNAADDLADLLRLAQRVVGSAQRVVEHDDALGAALGFDQRLHLRVVDASNFTLVVELLHFGIVAQEAKAVALQLKILRLEAAVVNGYAARIGLTARAGVAAAWTGDDRENLAAVIHDVIERRLDLVRRQLELGALGCGLRHGRLLLRRPSI
jgi:hypothetical protein